MKKQLGYTLVAAGVLAAATCAPIDPAGPDTQPHGHRHPFGLPAPTPPAAKSAAPASQGLRERIELAVDQVKRREVLATHGFWTIFHAILGLGPSVELVDPDTKARFNALDHIAKGGEVRGMSFLPTRDGLDVQTGQQMFVGQGHQDQFVAEMAQWGMAPERKFVVEGRDYTFRDFINHTKMRARVTSNQELSWAIVIIGQYLGTDLAWTNGHGEKLHYEDVVRYELNASVEEAACGGTHRLFGLTWAYHLHLQNGGKKEGVWKDVAEKTRNYQLLARKYQNPDGAFSTNFFRGPGNVPDKNLRINTTGHTLEWLALSLSDDELRQPWVQDAVNALALLFLDLRDSPIDGGPLYHAAHGLLIYYARVFDADKLGPNKPYVMLPPAALRNQIP
jgi:hypothetical protein